MPKTVLTETLISTIPIPVLKVGIMTEFIQPNVGAFEWAHERKEKIVWMSQNNNTLPTTPEIEEAIIDCARSRYYNLYPPQKGLPELKQEILKDLGLDPNEWGVMVTFGGTEALYVMIRALINPGDEVITTDPSYMIIHNFIKLAGGKTTDCPVYPAPGKFSTEMVRNAVTPKSKMLLLIDPLNPMGSAYTRQEVKELCEIAKENGLYIIDDITYRDFADEHTMTSEFYPEKTLIAYSVSKNAGLAGLRVGALVAHKHYLDKFKPYVVSELSIDILAQKASITALKTKHKWMPRVKEITRNNQKIIKDAVDSVPGCFLPVYPSQANMFCIDISGTGLNGNDIQNKLLYEHHVFVRAGDYVSKRFGPRFVRTSFSIPEEGVRKFHDIFPKVMEVLKAEKGAKS
jgi:aspartate/methionine/tyrosine aminotransferase